MWRQGTEELLTLERSELVNLLLRCARETDGSIFRFTTQFGECFRVGEYTSPPEHVRLNAKLRAALDALIDAGFVTQSGDLFALTDAGYEAAEEPRDVAIPSDAAPILDLLLRAGLCVPRFFEGSLAALPAIERDEMRDALSLGGIPLVQLTWEWAATRGDVPATASGPRDIDLTEFYEQLTGLARMFHIEVSAPLHLEFHADVPSLPPFPGQRIHLANRSEWLAWPEEIVDGEAAEAGVAETESDFELLGLPALTSAALAVGEERAGETWVRIRPESLATLREKPLALLELLRTVADGRMRQLRDAICQHARVYKSDELAALNELLTNVGRWHRILESVSADLAELPEEHRLKKAPGVLAIITTGEQPLEYRMDRVQTLDGLITELDNIVSTKDDTRFGTLHDRLTLWRERSTSFLREQVTTKAATDFCRLEPDVPWGLRGGSQLTTAYAHRYRQFLLALQVELSRHPESYVPTGRVSSTSATSSSPGSQADQSISLCLSGGGFRAMLFHVGVIWRLTEAGLLGRIGEVSSVSGGSITAAMLALKWQQLSPHTSAALPRFIAEVVAPLRAFARRTIDTGAFVRAYLPVLGRPAGNSLAASYERLFGSATLQDLPSEPVFRINATSLQTGERFVFSRAQMGDASIGLIKLPTTKLATAVAASSAFPPMLSPVVLRLDPQAFSPRSGTMQAPPFTETVVLTDGGVFDNLGLDGVTAKSSILLVSDGGAQMVPLGEPSLNWKQSVRAIEIIDNQVRALRVRNLQQALEGRLGALFSIRDHITAYSRAAENLGCPPERTTTLAKTRTRLAALAPTEQERLINWGYAVCDAALRTNVDASLPQPGAFPFASTGV